MSYGEQGENTKVPQLPDEVVNPGFLKTAVSGWSFACTFEASKSSKKVEYFLPLPLRQFSDEKIKLTALAVQFSIFFSR